MDEVLYTGPCELTFRLDAFGNALAELRPLNCDHTMSQEDVDFLNQQFGQEIVIGEFHIVAEGQAEFTGPSQRVEDDVLDVLRQIEEDGSFRARSL